MSVYILPFDIDGTIYVLQNERREIIGTGNREVCAALFEIMNDAKTRVCFESNKESHANIRSAVVI